MQKFTSIITLTFPSYPAFDEWFTLTKNYFLKENNNKGKKRIKPYLNPTMAESKIEPKHNTKEIIKNLFFIESTFNSKKLIIKKQSCTYKYYCISKIKCWPV